MAFGVTEDGFQSKSLEVIRTEVQEELRADINPGLNLTATSVLGQLIGILIGHLAELWEVLVATYSSLFPDSASGSALDNVCAITGTTRLDAQESTAADVICTGTAATVLPVGRVLSVTGAGDRFESTAEATLAAATAWAALTAYALGAVRTNSSNIYVVTTAGTSAGSGGPTGTGTAITDGSVTWRFVGTGTAYALVDFEAEETGPVAAAAFTLTTIETPVSGWSGAANRLDAEQGRDIETDPALRTRREQLLRQSGSSNVEAIRANVQAVADVLEAFVLENTTLTTDANGVPGKAFEVIVDGGDNTAIAEAIFDAKPAGIQAYGSTTVAVEDSQGVSHDIGFTRPTTLSMYVDVTLTVDATVFPADGEDLVKAAIVTEGDSLDVGDDVYILQIRAASLAVPGVLDVTVCKVDTVNPPVNTSNITITVRQLADFDTGRVSVTVA